MRADHPPALSSEFRPTQVSHDFSFALDQRPSTDENTRESISSRTARETPQRSATGKAGSTSKTSRARRNTVSSSSTTRSRKSGPSVSDSSQTSSPGHNPAGRATKGPNKKNHAVSESQRRSKSRDEKARAKEIIPKILYPEKPSKTHNGEIAELEVLRANRKYTAALVPYVEELTATLHEFMVRYAEEKAINQIVVKLLSDAQVTQANHEMAALSLDTTGSTWITEGPFRDTGHSKCIKFLTEKPCQTPSQSHPVSSPFASDLFSWLDDSKRYSSLREDVIRSLDPEKRNDLDQQEPFLIPVLAAILVEDAQA